jgi:Zn-dependent protease
LDLLAGVKILIPLVLSLTIHEFAHAWTAARLGDDTAARAGRLTLNPIAHVDLIGSILLPLLNVPFGWARPVPINPARFRRSVRMSTGTMLTAIAGPLSNLVLATACTVVLGILARYAPEQVVRGRGWGELLVLTRSINISLAVFNMIPIPPLDGSRVVEVLLPLRFRAAWEGFARLAPFLLLFLVFGGRHIMAVPIIAVHDLLDRLLGIVVGA